MERPTRTDEAPQPRDTHVREHLANERTLLSWVRLGLASAGFGFVVARFGLFLRELADPHAQVAPKHGAALIGIALVLLGPLVVVAGAIRYFRTEREIDAGDYTSRHGLIWSVVVVSVLLGLSLAGYLVLTGW